MKLTPFSFLKHFPNLLLKFLLFSPRMSLGKKPLFNHTPKRSILDLPDLVLECILEKLPPDGLFKMASVCSCLRDICSADHLWERHLKQKWGGVIGSAAYKEWQCRIASRKGSIFYSKEEGLSYFLHLWPLPLNRSRSRNGEKKPIDSIMAWYLALETGRCWFPAQVYNRENGNVGFVLSCYDAQLSYDRGSNTFQARYPPHGRRASAVEFGVTWNRLRAPAVDASPHDLHISDCLNDMQPGDQIEIQWRRSKEFPYGWWYGVVEHLETCDRNANYCRCHHSETLVLEFKQYTLGSRWRTTMLNRKHHREEGSEAIGFYGGIRKLCGAREVSMWEKLWPAGVLE